MKTGHPPRSRLAERAGLLTLASAFAACTVSPVTAPPSPIDQRPTPTVYGHATPIDAPSASQTAAVAAASAASVTPRHPAGPSWQALGSTELVPGIGIVGFDRGYVGYGVAMAISHSRDGANWRWVDLPPSPPECEDEEVDDIEAGATDGRSVVLLGAYSDAECRLRTFAVLSTDGLGWRRSEPFGGRRDFSEARQVDVWPVPGGWEAAIAERSPADPTRDSTTIWKSHDGLSWNQTATLEGQGSVDGSADDDGRRLLSITSHTVSAAGVHGQQVALLASTDGAIWDDVTLPFPQVAVVSRILAPNAAVRAEWVLWVTDYRRTDPDGPPATTILASRDLGEWTVLEPPDVGFATVAATSVGLLTTICDGGEESCAQYLRELGAGEWQSVSTADDHGYSHYVGDGPAGVLIVLESGDVYRLAPGAG